MSNIKNIKRLIEGIRRYGLLRTITGIIMVLRIKILNPNESVVTTFSDHIRIYYKYPTQFSPSLVIYRELVEPEYEFLRHILNKNSVFFDVGAGIGMYSIFAARFVNGNIHSFEPVEENIQTIKINLKANSCNSKVKLNAVALSNKEGFGRMKKGKKLFLSRLYDVSTNYHDNSINVTKLDTYCSRHNIKHIDILKIDAEGHEPEIIEGAEKMLNAKKINIIILELDPKLKKFYIFLKNKGFELFCYNYEKNFLKHVSPISEESLRSSRLSLFHSNIILIQHETIKELSKYLDINF